MSKLLLNQWKADPKFQFQGTDGVRARISYDPVSFSEALILFKTKSLLTPAFLELNCYAICELLKEQNILKTGDKTAFGGDGRDYYRDGLMRRACFSGFQKAGIGVIDFGVVPTPAVFICSAYYGLRLGTVLTASHNPSNQNGLKLFVDGYKLLPDEKYGDRALSRKMIELAETLDPEQPELSLIEDRAEEASRVFINVMKNRIPQNLDGVRLVYDTAQGAFSQLGPKLLKDTGMRVTVLNNTPNGENINQNGGVAEIEGEECFSGDNQPVDSLNYLPVVKELLTQGRQHSGLTAAIVHDGDGDRGFLLVYDPEKDQVDVLDGDRLAFIRTKMLIEKDEIQKSQTAVFTVESDLAAPVALRNQLGLSTSIVCVGDKWTVNEKRKGADIALAAESSGHVAEPVDIKDINGNPFCVIAGNGLLTTLHVLAYMKEKNLTAGDVRALYQPGLMKTYYTYFVDRSKFAHGSAAFETNKKIAQEYFKKSLADGLLPDEMQMEIIPYPDDADMLYMAFKEKDVITAACFVRNSGTELKIGINIRGEEKYGAFLEGLAENLNTWHKQNLKDPENPDYQKEKVLLEVLGKKDGGMDKAEAKKVLEEKISAPINDAEFSALLYGLKKEKSLQVNGDKIIRQ